MFCCDVLSELSARDLIRVGSVHTLPAGRFLTEIDTEYFFVSGAAERVSYIGLNYCPFCGRALSRGLWNREKKK